MTITTTERVAAYRERKETGIEVPTCDYCWRQVRGKISRRRLMCRFCFKCSADGKHQNWLLVNANRRRVVEVEHLKSWENWKVGQKVITPDGSIGTIKNITLYINGSIDAKIKFKKDSELFLISLSNPVIKRWNKN